ncbi:MAG: lysophospholipid acyltransferase family protein [Bacteroidales bacterium]|nr:lysophospholipid acyltransferase family protein [Bacteroidales bacterium]MDD4575686.1 lysophospholipid acyltransferase family protein [Bacteroidales bacterium]
MIGYKIFRLFSKFILILPWSWCYRISDFFAFMLLYVVKYRREVAINNLSRSFPEKSQKEIKAILKQTYKNISDIFIEVMKTEKMSKEDLKKRMKVENIELLNNLYDEGKSVIILAAHIGSWEWMGPRIQLDMKYDGYVAYKPLSNKHFDKYMSMLRSHFFEDRMVYFKTMLRFILTNKEELRTYIMPADQSPTKTEIGCWLDFMNQETGFFTGSERIASKAKFAVVFLDNKRIKRGQYNVKLSLISKDASKEEEFAITKEYAKLLEENLKSQPDNWLWTHKRWKHKRED